MALPEAQRWPRRTLDRIRQDGGTGALTAVVMAALVVITYIVVVPVGGAVIGQPGSPSLWLSVTATAIVALAFEPVRRRVSRGVASALGRERRTPYQVLTEFGSSVIGRYPAEELPVQMAKALAEATGALRAEVLVLVNGELTPAARWPSDARDVGSADHAAVTAHSQDVRDGSDLLGRFTVFLRADQQLTLVEERLFAGLAAQSGLMLRLAGLRADLRRQLDEVNRRTAELQMARRDLVSRQDTERKRLERNIHDGAQQQVLALLVNLRLARTLIGRSPERAAAVLEAQGDAARAGIDTLTALSRGLFPPLLMQEGPIAALRAAVASSPIPVGITAVDLPRQAAAQEAAVYFSCLEAVQNATKHSAASVISVEVVAGPDGLELTVTDDGRGFRPGEVRGSGLANIRDRIESVHGTVTIESGPAGTTVHARLPYETPVRAAS